MGNFLFIFKKLETKNKIIWCISFFMNCFQTLIVNVIFGFGFKIGLDSVLQNNLSVLQSVIFLLIVGGCYLIFVLPVIDYFMVKQAYNVKKKIMDLTFSKYLELHSLNSIHSASIIDFLQNDTKEASYSMDWDYVVIFQALFSGVGALIIMSFYNLEITALCMLVGICIFFVNLNIKKMNELNVQRRRKSWETLLKSVSDIIDNLKTIQVYGLTNFFRNKAMEDVGNVEKVENKIDNEKNVAESINVFMSDFLIYMIIICNGCVLVAKNQITIGTILLFLQLSVGVTFLFQSVGDYFLNCNSINFSIDRITKFINFPEIICNKDKTEFEFKKGNIECRKVSFKYENNSEFILDKLNFCVESGDLFLIRGNNGVGKSTLAKILANIYLPNKGEILLDGFETKNIKKADYPSYIGYVPQECFFIKGNLIENIELGYKNYNREYLEELFEICELKYLLVRSKEDISEKGKNLSFGEKARISLIRAMLRNPEIIVLDEFDANIEVSLYLRVLDYLLKKNKTIILIDHKMQNYAEICRKNNVNLKVFDMGDGNAI
jgi:ABC-type bacteriocin/lantibiotic exporter with double-glycine peptidase domain